MLPSLFSSGQPRHSHQWSAEAFTPMGSRGTHTSGQPRHPFLAASGQPRHSHPWAAEEFTPMAPVSCFQCLASSVLLSLQWHQWTAEAPVSCFQCANEAFTRVRSVGIHSNGQPRHSHQWAAEAPVSFLPGGKPYGFGSRASTTEHSPVASFAQAQIQLFSIRRCVRNCLLGFLQACATRKSVKILPRTDCSH